MTVVSPVLAATIIAHGRKSSRLTGTKASMFGRSSFLSRSLGTKPAGRRFALNDSAPVAV
jgi:hypothetical protein